MKNATQRSFSYWQQKAQQFSNLYTNTNIPFFPSSIVACFLKDRTKLLLSLLPPPPIHHLLDLGCGSGHHIKLLITSCEHIVGVDYSKQMLELAKKNLKNLKIHTWQLIHTDAANLPVKTRSFDCVIAMGLLDYIPSPQQVLKECRRVITSKGICIITVPKKPSLFSLLRNPLGDFIKRVIFHLPPIDNAITKTELETLAKNTGFHILSVKSLWDAMWIVKMKPHDVFRKRKIANT